MKNFCLNDATMFSKKENNNNNKKIVDLNMIKEVKELLNSTSMKEKYEGLLKRELILPHNFKILFKKFENLDYAIFAIKKNKNFPSLANVQNYFKEQRSEFTLDDFKRILYVVPHFFIYKWEKLQNSKNSQTELIIEIPNNIASRLKVINYLNNKKCKFPF